MKIKELFESMSHEDAAKIFARFGVKNAQLLSPEQLKKIYFALGKKNHPDMGGSDKAMKEINTAYDVLSKPQQKTKSVFKWSPPKWKGFDFGKEWEDFDKKKKEQEKKPEPPKHVDIFV